MITLRMTKDAKVAIYSDNEGRRVKVRFKTDLGGPNRHIFVADGILTSYSLDKNGRIIDAKAVIDGEIALDVYCRIPVYEDGRWYIVRCGAWNHRNDFVTNASWRRVDRVMVFDNMSDLVFDRSSDYTYCDGRVRPINFDDEVFKPSDIVVPRTIRYGEEKGPIKVRSIAGNIRFLVILSGDVIGEWCTRTGMILWTHVHRGIRGHPIHEVIFVADNVVQYTLRTGYKVTLHYYNITDGTQYDI